MIHFYSDEQYCPKDKQLIRMPYLDYFVKNHVPYYFDDSDSQIIQEIEGTKLIDKGFIQSKFSTSFNPISINYLSDGCKTILCVNYAVKNGIADKIIFNVSSCGENAVQFLLEYFDGTDVNALCEHTDFGDAEGVRFMLNDKVECKSCSEMGDYVIYGKAYL